MTAMIATDQKERLPLRRSIYADFTYGGFLSDELQKRVAKNRTRHNFPELTTDIINNSIP